MSQNINTNDDINSQAVSVADYRTFNLLQRKHLPIHYQHLHHLQNLLKSTTELLPSVFAPTEAATIFLTRRNNNLPPASSSVKDNSYPIAPFRAAIVGQNQVGTAPPIQRILAGPYEGPDREHVLLRLLNEVESLAAQKLEAVEREATEVADDSEATEVADDKGKGKSTSGWTKAQDDENQWTNAQDYENDDFNKENEEFFTQAYRGTTPTAPAPGEVFFTESSRSLLYDQPRAQSESNSEDPVFGEFMNDDMWSEPDVDDSGDYSPTPKVSAQRPAPKRSTPMTKSHESSKSKKKKKGKKK